ncbi:MAG: bifunctional isocitrate dehydrogenase kinase/phosphatase [Thiomonas sp. 20-64-9]|jgi:isocitrate dehydrogenase kinase/phosphatase|uniref:bifunctional isocitrate dehydrogenase kinase/phosphatase n=1 Tax=unclassified Thiomonas TaxID=2625466 RepID=UPI000ADD956F|nr:MULTISPECIES: bifunctional isocitrate dehydrogenase kinase/phosphatase [unclassified Thiomonas]OYV31591.1 MAG: bifunctional isocitrate dehydrogenase kinase/phosphatase [Thiomonas sp. 20-64-9]OZB71796.1 MAG: bifunctional isocitrate dehydrogenase kinase/phosphatase [Thiomonas sp. 13-64-67]
MNQFPPRLDSPVAFAMARTMLEGFNRHYRLFRQVSAAAKQRFERADWAGQQAAQRERIAFYDQRVDEATERLQNELDAGNQPMEIWQQAKLHYIGLLTNHHQPELAETFFNSVTTKILRREHFNNEFLFVRPALSTEYIENEEPAAKPTFRVYYPHTHEALHACLRRAIENFQLALPFEDLDRDVRQVLAAVRQRFGSDVRLRANFQIQMLDSLFYRNKGAYAVGKVINGFTEFPLALPILHNERGQLFIDTVLLTEDDLLLLFSFARAYFMVDMEIPSAYVQFLRSLMARKPRAELYNALGLAKQGKTLFYRDFLYHLRHSSDQFIVAPGIKGMVMVVFTLPSFPFVFKVIKDFYPPQKDTTRDKIKGKYLLVKQHDRVGRMAETLEYSNVAFERARFSPELIQEIETFCPSQLEYDGDTIIIRHCYIERRMIPLNIYLQEADDAQLDAAVIEYGNAIKDMVAANIFPGDMLWKNFGITRHGKVVFYDYDEIEYITDCNFRRVPAPRNEEDEMAAEPWYAVGPHDVFPETFGQFLLGNPKVRAVFMKHHADLLDAAFWQEHQSRIREGHLYDVFTYDATRRFAREGALAASNPPVQPVQETST